MMTRFKKTRAVSLSTIKEFVYFAKRKAFALTDKKTTLLNQSSIYSVRGYGDEGYSGDRRFSGLIYNDEYSGNTIEAGYETVSQDFCNVWRNQYYGGTFIQHWNASEIESPKIANIEEVGYFPYVTTAFLKQALMHLPEDFPIRGPKHYQADLVEYEGRQYCGNWEYENNWKGMPIYNIDDPFAAFQGEEIIKCNGVPIYWHGYQGGFLRDKYYPISLSR